MAVIQYITPTQPADSTNGLTMYRNGGQLAMRSRAYPLRNKSQAHIVPMNAIATLSMLWESPLTNADRIAWGNYAFATPLTDAYGNPVYVKGYAHFMRVNRPLLQHGLPLQLLPPASSGLPTFSPVSMRVFTTTTIAQVKINTTDAWANQTGAHMMLWISRPRSPRRRYAPEVYKPLGTIAGNSTTAPPIYNNFVNPWGTGNNNFVQWIRPSIIDINGRLSAATNSMTDDNPKTMGTNATLKDPCAINAICTFNVYVGPITQGTNGIICQPMPNTPTINQDVTNLPGFFWVYNPTIGGKSYNSTYRVQCPFTGGIGHCSYTFQCASPFVSCQWAGTCDRFGNSVMPASFVCTTPSICIVTQV